MFVTYINFFFFSEWFEGKTIQNTNLKNNNNSIQIQFSNQNNYVSFIKMRFGNLSFH
jgi:hypothetical protein